MSLLDRIFAEPELREFPPVLVDVGAAGGVHPAWRRIARYAVGVGFEPDAREAAPLGAAAPVPVVVGMAIQGAAGRVRAVPRPTTSR